MTAFVATNRLYVIIEGVLDVHPIPRPSATPAHFLSRASSALSGFRQSKDLKEAEVLLEEWCRLLPSYWSVTPETMASRDVIRITQAERLHCTCLGSYRRIESKTKLITSRPGTLRPYAYRPVPLQPAHLGLR